MSKVELPKGYSAPRICLLMKWPEFEGYGFNLQAEKGKSGQFVGKVDANSPAASAGLLPNQRIIEVNGTNISNENHQQVVQRIKLSGDSVELLVCDKRTEEWAKQRKYVIRDSTFNCERWTCPERPPQDTLLLHRVPSEVGVVEMERRSDDAVSDSPPEMLQGDDEHSSQARRRRGQLSSTSSADDRRYEAVMQRDTPYRPRSPTYEDAYDEVLEVFDEATVNGGLLGGIPDRQAPAAAAAGTATFTDARTARTPSFVEDPYRELPRTSPRSRNSAQSVGSDDAGTSAEQPTKDTKADSDRRRQRLERGQMSPLGVRIKAPLVELPTLPQFSNKHRREAKPAPPVYQAELSQLSRFPNAIVEEEPIVPSQRPQRESIPPALSALGSPVYDTTDGLQMKLVKSTLLVKIQADYDTVEDTGSDVPRSGAMRSASQHERLAPSSDVIRSYSTGFREVNNNAPIDLRDAPEIKMYAKVVRGCGSAPSRRPMSPPYDNYAPKDRYDPVPAHSQQSTPSQHRSTPSSCRSAAPSDQAIPARDTDSATNHSVSSHSPSNQRAGDYAKTVNQREDYLEERADSPEIHHAPVVENDNPYDLPGDLHNHDRLIEGRPHRDMNGSVPLTEQSPPAEHRNGARHAEENLSVSSKGSHGARAPDVREASPKRTPAAAAGYVPYDAADPPRAQPDSLGIGGLSASEMKELLKSKKRRDIRDQKMSLKEKIRLADAL